jgi:hypothetical protein
VNISYTPGPWRDVGHRTIFGPPPGDLLICECFSGGVGVEQADANLRLIAAAPDLVAKGKQFCNLVEAFLRAGDAAVPASLRNVTEAQVATVMYELRAFIAYAAGETG